MLLGDINAATNTANDYATTNQTYDLADDYADDYADFSLVRSNSVKIVIDGHDRLLIDLCIGCGFRTLNWRKLGDMT